jgi:anti-anti-sigma regulatory factor
VRFCDSSGIRALVDAQRAAFMRDVPMRITEPSGLFRRSLEVTNVLTRLTGGIAAGGPSPIPPAQRRG